MASDKDVLEQADALLRRHSISAPASGSDTGGVPILTDLVDDPNAADALAREVSRRVLAEVEGRLGAELERRLALHLVPQVRAAVASAIADLHEELASAIGDAVAEAIKQRAVK